MIVGIVRELFPGEQRVALVPGDLPALRKLGLEVVIEAGAGVAAGFPDGLYVERGAKVLPDRAAVFAEATVLAQVRAAGADLTHAAADLKILRSGQVLIAMLEPLWEPQSVAALADRGVSALALELVPRISRAQSMDVLSSMATIAGYKAVLLAASYLPRIFPMLMTAAGTLTPARAFVIGAGVAGLQAAATAKRLGARVEAYDVRPVVKEQVESVGASFVELPIAAEGAEDKGGYARALGDDFYRRQRELMAKVVARNDLVITTAAIPGKPAPVLITAEMVADMHPGSVIVDLAAERGGNCELSKPDETVVANGVTILGPTNLAATVPNHASQLYSRNLLNLLGLMVKDRQLQLESGDEVIAGTLVTHKGAVVHERIKELLAAPVS